MNLKAFLLTSDPVGELWERINDGTVAELEPALAALRMEIPKGWHHKDNLGHTARVLKNAIERETDGPDLILRTAALLHDIGKPATRKFPKPGLVTFQNHETVGARQSRSILKANGYSAADRSEIEHLISLHMRAFGFGDVKWSESAVRRLGTDAGSDQALDRLIKIFYSDLTTKNEGQRRKIEGGIARLETALAEVRAKDERAALRPALDGYELMAMTGLKQGRELGAMMRLLNRDDVVTLTRDDALALLRAEFPTYFGARDA